MNRITSITSPIYKHHCNACDFVGVYELGYTQYDGYFCKQSDEGTVVLRYGNQGFDYASAPKFIFDHPGVPKVFIYQEVYADYQRMKEQTHDL